MTEHEAQAAFFAWARAHPVAKRAFAIPNGGHRHVATAARLKAEGVRKGVLDVFLPVLRGGAAGLWIEMKSGYNDLTPEQSAEADELFGEGYAVAVCWGAIVAIEIASQYLDGKIGPSLMVMKPERPRSRSKRQALSAS